MGWIRYPNAKAIQAVHKGNGKEVAVRYLRFADYGYDKAHDVARRWLRYCMYVRPPLPRTRHKPQAHKKQPYPRGVSYIEYEGRNARYARMSVYWHDGERPRNKTFCVGPIATLTETELSVAVCAATAFRNAYLAHKVDGELFDPSDWDHWREDYALPNT